jgi:hypothetical protein
MQSDNTETPQEEIYRPQPANQLFKDKKFAYRHKATQQWVFFEPYVDESNNHLYHIHLLDNFHPDILWAARNIIAETLEVYSTWAEDHCHQSADMCGQPKLDEFELIAVEVTHYML